MDAMHETFLHTLQTNRGALCARWEVLLRAEPVSSPLANPDTLVHLMSWTLDHLVAELKRPRLRRRPDGQTKAPPCPCGRNPLLRYFATAERAIIETLFVNGVEIERLDPIERDAGLQELKIVLAHLARGEIESFCAVCQHTRPAASAHAPMSTAAARSH